MAKMRPLIQVSHKIAKVLPRAIVSPEGSTGGECTLKKVMWVLAEFSVWKLPD